MENVLSLPLTKENEMSKRKPKNKTKNEKTNANNERYF